MVEALKNNAERAVTYLRQCRTNIATKGGTITATAGLSEVASKILEIPGDKLTGVYVDNEVAYRKQVPPNSAGFCYLNSIGGMTYKGFTFDCVVEERDGMLFAPYEFDFPKEFTLPEYDDGSMWTFEPIVVGFTDALFYDLVGTDCKLTGRKIKGAGYGVTGVTVGTQLRCIPRFADYMGAATRYYYPPECFTDLRDAKPTAVKSYGANLIPFPYKDTASNSGGVSFVVNDDHGLTINGSPTVSYKEFSFSSVLPLSAGTYCFSAEGLEKASSDVYIFVRLINKKTGARIEDKVSLSATTISSSFTVTEAELQIGYLQVFLRAYLGASFDNVTIRPMLNLGTTALPYAPYREPITYPLPTAITDKLGKGCSDTIFDEYSFVDKKAITRVGEGVVDELSHESSTSKRSSFLQVGFKEMRDTSNGYYVAQAQMPFFDFGYSIHQINADGYLEYVGTIYGKNLCLYVPTPLVSADVNAFISWVNSQNFRYLAELAAYTETPITLAPTDFDGLIEVEAGGYLEFVNEYGYPVPSTVTFSLINGGGTT